MRKRRIEGFTLVETIVVLVILAIVMAIAIPAFMGYIEKGKETACQANRRNVRLELIMNHLELDTLTQEQLQQWLRESEVQCPSGGTYTIEVAADFETTRNFGVICSIHGGEVPGESDRNKVSQGLRKDFMAYVKDHQTELGNSNARLRRKFYEENGGQWPTLTVDGRVYYIQPYYSQQADPDLPIDQRVWLYATTDPGLDGGWFAPYVLDPVDLQWYEAPRWNGASGGSVSINTVKDAQELHNDILNKTHSSGKNMWKELENYTESAPVK